MKKQKFPVLIILTIAFCAFTLGFYLGNNRHSQPVTLSVPADMITVPPEASVPQVTETVPVPTVSFPIDLNQASEDDLTFLPGIGEVLARRIIAHRDEYGPFTHVEDILNVEGIGKKRFEDIYDLIAIGG